MRRQEDCFFSFRALYQSSLDFSTVSRSCNPFQGPNPCEDYPTLPSEQVTDSFQTNELFSREGRVRRAGLEPATKRLTYHLQFSLPVSCLWSGLSLYPQPCCLGSSRQVSTPSLSGLARDCHATGFPEFDCIHLRDFSRNALLRLYSLPCCAFAFRQGSHRHPLQYLWTVPQAAFDSCSCL